jgi:sec-independent protein translocase protein TatB
MFDLGIQELILIFIVALVVFGPDRLPELAKGLGKGLADLKNTLSGVRDQVDSEFKEITSAKEIQELKNIADPLALKERLFGDDTLIKPDAGAPAPAEPRPEAAPTAPEPTAGRESNGPSEAPTTKG